MAGMALHLDVLERDLAARLAIELDEALRLIARKARFHVLVVVQHIALALIPDRRRQLHLLAALEREQRTALGHARLAAPIGVLARDDRFRPLGRIGLRER